MTAKEILALIENVYPSDTAMLDEIDARVTEYVDPSFKAVYYDYGSYQAWRIQKDYGGTRPYLSTPGEYTRSRDALKAIRPKEWFFTSQMIGMDFAVFNGWFYAAYGQSSKFVSSALPTEELAELHAIIQAIEYERSK